MGIKEWMVRERGRGSGHRASKGRELMAWAPAARKTASLGAFSRAHLKALQASQIHHVIAAFWNKAH